MSQPEPEFSLEQEALDALIHTNRNLIVLARMIALADEASHAFHRGDYLEAFERLQAYRAYRQEHADTNLP